MFDWDVERQLIQAKYLCIQSCVWSIIVWRQGFFHQHIQRPGYAALKGCYGVFKFSIL